MKQTAKKLLLLIASCIILSTALYCKENTLYQLSDLNRLFKGDYKTTAKCSEVLKEGDFGIGTFEALDGEMLVLDGIVYRIRADGKVYKAEGEVLCPYIQLTTFKPGETVSLTGIKDYKALESRLNGLLTDQNAYYAIKISGEFDYLKVRSIPKQEQPYPPLPDVIKKQSAYEHRNVKGTFVGFFTPEKDRNPATAYHFHFIDSEKNFGGHVLELNIKDATIEIELLDKINLR